MAVTSALLLLFMACAAIAINVEPKLDFSEQSPGISPETIKKLLKKEELTISPGVVKATLEVNVGGTSKPEPKADGKKKKKKNQVLICTLDGDCKLHEISVPGGDDDDEDDDAGKHGKKKLKPVIVTNFDVNPVTEKHKPGRHGGDDDSDEKPGKFDPHVPVFVGEKGANKDLFPYFYAPGYQPQVYYGMKLSPEFHQQYPGSVIYEEDHHYPPHQHSSYPNYHYGHETSYLYDDHPHQDYPDYTAYKHYDNHHFSGPMTPTPYDKYYPNRPGYHAVITPLDRRTGGSGWSWSPDRAHQGGGGWVGSNRPGGYWPRRDSSEDGALVVAVNDKMDFDEDSPIPGGGTNPPTGGGGGGGTVTVDGKLGEPLDKSEQTDS